MESHLRERVEHIKSGLSEAEAFNVAAQELGNGKVLKKEFSKGRLLWRLRGNPAALNLLAGWFVLGGLNNLLQLIWLYRADWPWENASLRYRISLILAVFSLQLLVGIGLLSRGKFWRYGALVFCALCIVSATWGVANLFFLPPGWNSPGHYFLLMGLPVPAKFELSVNLLNLGLLLWGIYILSKTSVRNLFRPRIA